MNKRRHFGMAHKVGENWLLLRGLSREAAHWGDFLPHMQAVFPEARVSTLDLPGTGIFHQQKSPDTIAEIVDAVRLQAQQQGLLQQPLTVLALSMGGMVAWEWMLKFPQDINAAVLINTSLASLSPFYRRLRWQSYGKLLAILSKTDVFSREQAILQLVSNLRQNDAKNAQLWGEIQRLRPVSAMNSLRQIKAAASYKPPQAVPTQKLLLLNSRQDRLVNCRCTQDIQDLGHLAVYTHPWAGHDLSLDDGTWLTEHLKHWLSSYSQ
jgi:pimeloyl-ACP methyl ester carboxylesterase